MAYRRMDDGEGETHVTNVPDPFYLVLFVRRFFWQFS